MTEAQILLMSIHLVSGIFGVDTWDIDVTAAVGLPWHLSLKILVLLSTFVIFTCHCEGRIDLLTVQLASSTRCGSMASRLRAEASVLRARLSLIRRSLHRCSR